MVDFHEEKGVILLDFAADAALAHIAEGSDCFLVF